MKRLTPLLLSAALLSACAHGPPPKPVVWPDPPEKPRIRFVKAILDVADVDDTNWGKFWRAILGRGSGVTVSAPMGLALTKDGKRLYIAEPALHRVLVADFEAKKLYRFPAEESMYEPFNVALDDDDNVYVSDGYQSRIFVFKPNGDKLRSFGKETSHPTGLALDRARRLLYVANTSKVTSGDHGVLVYSTDGILERTVGNGRGSDDGQFNFPLYLALDRGGNLYVADSMNFRIQVFDPDGKFLRTYGSAGDGPGTFARIKGLALDGFGNVYAVEEQHAVVQMFNRSFDMLMAFGGPSPRLEYLEMPTAIAIDPATNRIYVGSRSPGRVNVYELFNTTAEDSAAGGQAAPVGR